MSPLFTHTHSLTRGFNLSLSTMETPPSSVTTGIWMQDLGRAGAESRVKAQRRRVQFSALPKRWTPLHMWLWSVWTAPQIRGWGCVGGGRGLPGCGKAPRRSTQGQLHLHCRCRDPQGDRQLGAMREYRQIVMVQPERPR